jgi:hypothetical protein
MTDAPRSLYDVSPRRIGEAAAVLLWAPKEKPSREGNENTEKCLPVSGGEFFLMVAVKPRVVTDRALSTRIA